MDLTRNHYTQNPERVLEAKQQAEVNRYAKKLRKMPAEVRESYIKLAVPTHYVNAVREKFIYWHSPSSTTF